MMMKLSVFLVTMFSCSVFATGKNVEYANVGVDYQSIIVKFNSDQNPSMYLIHHLPLV
ncbi:exported hypothetical protein [Vibrio aestuarianus]|nr:exported hypothetical protein [Vibrio aestuarianus]